MKYRQKGPKYLCKKCGDFTNVIIDEWADCYNYLCQTELKTYLFEESYKCNTVLKIEWKSREQMREQVIKLMERNKKL